MAYCEKCGHELNPNAKFCYKCGAVVKETTIHSERKTVYEGTIHKCPNCGEVLNSFISNCPSCGYEIRDALGSEAIQKFATKLYSVENRQEKITIIRNFPIPNTKEDILEFMILASTNVGDNTESDISSAWKSKTDQAYHKAQIIIKDEKEFAKIEKLYSEVGEKITKQKRSAMVKKAGAILEELTPYLPNIVIVLGWLISIFVMLPLCGVNVDNVGFNGYQLLLMLDLIAGAIMIPMAFKCESVLPKLITSFGLILSIIILIPLCNKNLDSVGFSSYQLILIVDIICSVIILIRMLKQGKYQTTKTALSKNSFIISLMCIVILLIAYGISSIVTFISVVNDNEETEQGIEEKREQEILHKQTATYKWPTSGLSTYLPTPQNKHGDITQDDESCFKITLYQTNAEDFENYLTECKEKGFTVDSTKNTNSYEAYNSDGYKFYLHLNENDAELSITLYDPIKRKKINWSTVPMMKEVPTPPSDVGEFGTNFDWTVSVYVLDVTYEEYEAYVDKCIKKGFTVDFTRYDTWFSGENKDGYEIDVSWEGNNTIHIDVTNLDLM